MGARDCWRKPAKCVSRNEVVRIDFEDCGNFRPGLADDLIGRSPFQGLQVLGEVVGGDEGQDMDLQAVQIVEWKTLTVASLMVRFIVSTCPLSGMRSVGALLSTCFRKGDSDMVSPSWTRGAGSTKVRAGRR